MGAVKSVIRCEAALGLLLEPMAELSLIRSLISLSVTLTSNKCTLETRGKEAGADVEMHQMIKCSVSISKKKKVQCKTVLFSSVNFKTCKLQSPLQKCRNLCNC